MKNPFDFDEEGLDKLCEKASETLTDRLASDNYTGRDEIPLFILAIGYQGDTRNSINYLRFVDPSIVSKALDRLAIEEVMRDVELSDEDRRELEQIKRLQGNFSSKRRNPLDELYKQMREIDKDLEHPPEDRNEASDLILGLGIYTRARAVREVAKYAWEIHQKIIEKSN